MLISSKICMQMMIRAREVKPMVMILFQELKILKKMITAPRMPVRDTYCLFNSQANSLNLFSILTRRH
jgi:hypothetical protein